MSFEHDAFISYAHIDNQPLLNEKDGWVTKFDQVLRQRLDSYVGKEVAVWRDPKLHGNDVFDDEIISRLGKAAVLISVMSPRYVNSEWCTKEIVNFFEVAQKNHGVLIGNKSRIFKVMKTPLGKSDSLPQPIAELIGKVLGYEFYRVEEDTPIELDPEYGAELRQEFLRRVNTVAWNVKQMLDELAGSTPPTPKPTVYLAECGRDRRDARDVIGAELRRVGYTVLPDREFPQDETAYMAQAAEMLGRADLSVHFVGAAYGVVPDGVTEKSVVMLQNEIAARISRENGRLKRIISLPAEPPPSANEPQKKFITALHSDAEMQFNADLIIGGTEELKIAIRSALEELSSPPQVRTKTEEKLLYVMCDPRDTLLTAPLVKSLTARGVRVELPLVSGEAGEVREGNQELMMSADAIVLFFGSGDDSWKFYQDKELTKVRAQRRDQLPWTFTYVAAPSTEKKQWIVTTESNVIDGLNGFSEEAVKPLLRKLDLLGDDSDE
jgi:hypothetical protein